MNEHTVRKINIAGTGISDITLSETIATFDDWIRTGQKKRVSVIPVNCVVWAHGDGNLQRIYNSADLSLCDGVPLIWLSYFLGNGKLRGRVTGLDLLPAFIGHCHEKEYSMYFLGGSEETLRILQQKLYREYPNIRIAGSYSPPYASKFSKEENEKMIAMINAASPSILWVSLTAPKQDIWINEHFHRLESCISIGIGGALDVLAGNIKRAPKWMQKNGLEWLFRFICEPKRLFKRYFIEAPQIIPLILQQKLKKLKKSTAQNP